MSYYVDEENRLHVVNGDSDFEVYAKISGGTLGIIVRAESEDKFNEVGLQVGLLKHQNDGSPEQTDPETGEVIVPAVSPSGPIVSSNGCTVTRIGPYVLVQGNYDDEGNELTPPTIDPRFHVNAWLSPEATKRGEWEAWIVQWMSNGTLAQQNKSEVALKYQGVELIDPLTVGTPSNVLL